jgi:hypothetical protein
MFFLGLGPEDYKNFILSLLILYRNKLERWSQSFPSTLVYYLLQE